MSKKLFVPGPIDVSEDVLGKMATQVISHRGKEASDLQKEITEKLQKLFFTKNNILLSTSSGSGLMEGSIRSCTLKRAAVLSCGSFGDRWYKMGISNGVPVDLFKVELGKAIEPEMVDKVLSTNKYDTIMVTHNETSTGIANPIKEIGEVIKKYDDIIENIQNELDEFQIYQFIMILFNDFMAFLGSCFDSVESEQDYYKLLKAYNIMMEICKKNGGLEDEL